jgi:outer membrane biosynthesis protein TonB
LVASTALLAWGAYRSIIGKTRSAPQRKVAQAIDLAARSATLSAYREDIFVDGSFQVKAAAILACLIGNSQPAGAQSLFGLFGADDSSATPEEKWKRTIARQLRERAPRLILGHGRVVAHFHVDRAGRVTEVKFESYSSDTHALVVASMISSLKLPPPPPTVGRDCCWFTQSVWFE